MCFMAKRYSACALFGHQIKGEQSYDRESCEQAKSEGAFGYCPEVQNKYAPEFTRPFCPTCSSMEGWLFNKVKASMTANLAAGRFEKPILTETLIEQLRGEIEAPDRAPVVNFSKLTIFLEMLAVTVTEERQAYQEAIWVNHNVTIGSYRVSMDGMTDQFASWVTLAYRLRVIEDAMAIAKSEQDEHRLQLLQMLTIEAEAISRYKARLEHVGVWQLFLSFAGIGEKLEAKIQKDDSQDISKGNL